MKETDKPQNEVFEKEKSLLLDHNYDGIEEFDYPLPNWWIWVFIVTSVFGVFYILFFHVLGGPSIHDEYESKMEKLNAIRAAQSQNLGVFDQESYKLISTEKLTRGQEVFNENCVACHREQGAGDIGPNLTDEYWIHGDGTPEAVYSIVRDGVEEKGMPIWSEVLNKDELYAVTAYIQTLKGLKVEGAKEPQGSKIERTDK